MSDDFYIGWEDKAAPGIDRGIRWVVVGLLLLAIFASVALAISQRTIGAGVFEWGMIKKFSGVLELNPYPHLLVSRPHAVPGSGSFSTYYLVAPFKHGLDRSKLSELDGKEVTLMGTLVYRKDNTLVEALPDSFKASDKPSAPPRDTNAVELGRQTLVGEIVDSKCYLGVMNPGQLLAHRGCAISCISGGIPPILLVQRADGPPIYLLLVSGEGKPVNQQVLDMVAEPVQITGDVRREGDLLILYADPASYRRVN